MGPKGRANVFKSSNFSALGENDRYKAISILSRIPCAINETLEIHGDMDVDFSKSTCPICEENGHSDTQDSSWLKHQEVSAEAISAFEALLKSTGFQDSKRCRVMAMFALRRFAVHFHSADLIDLEVSSLGQWCLTSLRSSIRELRIAAG
jgi:serine/threonine-protein kinase ATR